MTAWNATLRAVLVAGFGVGLSAAPLAAQESDAYLRGLLLTQGSGRPVQGAHIKLIDPDEVVLSEVLSDERGAFNLPMPALGIYRLQVTRIGYQFWTSDTLHIASAPESRELRLEVPVQPIPLPEMSVSERNTCPTTPEERQRAFEIYQSVQPALASSSPSADLGNLLVRMVRPVIVGKYDYWRRGGGRRFQQDTTTVVVPGSLNLLSAPPTHLATHGYADIIQDTLTTFYAPTGEALASPEFLSMHCLRPVASADQASVGLGFEPKPGRQLVDVKGVLWIDPITNGPERVEFQYTSLRPFLRLHLLPVLKAYVLSRTSDEIRAGTRFRAIEFDESEYGGVLYFERIPGDQWLIREWSLNSPTLYRRAVTERRKKTVWPLASPLTTRGVVLAVIPR